MTVTVLGATGGQGGHVVAALLAQGVPVRAVVRNASEQRAHALAGQGVEVVEGDMSDVASLTAAFTGVGAAFGLTTPFEAGLDAEVRQGEAIIEAAGRAGLPHLVMASVASADRHTGIPHFETKARVEAALTASEIPATVVAPSYFYDNAYGSVDEIAAGVMTTGVPADKPLQQVSRRDYGLLVAAVIADRERWLGQRIEVAGDEPTPAQMAEVIGRVAGGLVEVRVTPLESLRASHSDMGAMFVYLAETGYQVDIPRLRAEFPQISWTPFAEWAAEQRWPTPRR